MKMGGSFGDTHCGSDVEQESSSKTAHHDPALEEDDIAHVKLEPVLEFEEDYEEPPHTDPLALAGEESTARTEHGSTTSRLRTNTDKKRLRSSKKKGRRSKLSTSTKQRKGITNHTACPHCSKKFKLSRQVYKHIKVVHDNDPTICEECGKTFKNKELRRVHFRRVHMAKDGTAKPDTSQNVRPPFIQKQHHQLGQLPGRSKIPSTQSPLLASNGSIPWTWEPWEQIRTPVTGRVEFIVCNSCRKSFQDTDSFVQHSQLHKATDSAWKCEPCNKYFRTERHLLKHTNKVHLAYETDMTNEPSPTYAQTTFPATVSFADDWFESNTSENSPLSQAGQLHAFEMEANAAQTQTPVRQDKVRVGDLMGCPKLKMRMTVLVKRYNPPVWRRGYVFCDLCCRNFRSTYLLKFHMKLVHGLEYQQKRTTPRIRKILAEMRGHAWKCSSRLSTKRSRKSDPKRETKERNEETAGSEAEKSGVPAVNSNTTESGASKVLGETCPFCGKTCRSKAKLEYHIGIVHEDSPRKCRFCEKVLATSDKLSKHMRAIHENVSTEPTPSPCDVCGIVFDTHQKVNLHKKRVHEKRPVHTCKDCGKSYKTKGALWSHAKAWHKNQKKMCDQCGKSFTQPGSLRNHLLLVHNETAEPKNKDLAEVRSREPEFFQCEDCGRTFKHRDAYSCHRKVKHLKEKTYRCLFCNVKTYTSRLKRLHEVQYHGSPTGYGCKVCDQFCETPNALERHVLYDHSKDVLEEVYYGPAQWIDPPTTKSTSLLGRFTIQYESQVGRNKLEKYQNPFMSAEEWKSRQDWNNRNKPRDCVFCGDTCTGRTEEAKHIAEVHPDYAEYRCTECRLAFPDLRRYNQHMERLHAVKNKRSIIAEVDKSRLFGCDFCAKYFMSQSGMERHKESAHSDSTAEKN